MWGDTENAMEGSNTESSLSRATVHNSIFGHRLILQKCNFWNCHFWTVVLEAIRSCFYKLTWNIKPFRHNKLWAPHRFHSATNQDSSDCSLHRVRSGAGGWIAVGQCQLPWFHTFVFPYQAQELISTQILEFPPPLLLHFLEQGGDSSPTGKFWGFWYGFPWFLSRNSVNLEV